MSIAWITLCYNGIMIGETIKQTAEEQKQTGWEEIAKLAENKQSMFKRACDEGNREMRVLDGKIDGSSSFFMAFNGFTETCSEKSAECIDTAAKRAKQLFEEKDSEIDILLNNWRAGVTGGRWGSRGEMGTGEYIFETLGSKCEPKNIGRLETISKTIPSSDFARFENMRMDAYRIEGVVVGGRSFIHDCAPEAYRLISAMVDYYDARDDEEKVEEKRVELSELLSELRNKHGAGYTDPHEEYMFDLANYDMPAKDYCGDGAGLSRSKETEGDKLYDGERNGVKAIDILRRLEKNMEPVPLNAPQTKIPELNAAFSRLGQTSVNEQTSELEVSIDDLAEVLDVMNRHLLENQGQRTLFPSTISAVAYIDKLSAAALKNCSKKAWREIAFDPAFKEMLRFSQLTMGGGYSENEFERMYSKFTQKASEAFKEDRIDDQKIAEAYGIVRTQSLKNAEAVANEFSDNPHLEYLSKAVWSGNLMHELIGLGEKY